MATRSEGCYAPVQADNVARSDESIDLEDAPAQSARRQCSRRLIAGGVLIIVGIVVVIIHAGATSISGGDVVATERMVGLATKASVPSAAELEKQMGEQLADIKKERPEAWMQMKELQKAENRRKARKLLEHLNNKSKEEARSVVDDAIQRAAIKAVAQQQDRSSKSIFRKLKKFQNDHPPWVADGVNALRDFHADKKKLQDLRIRQTAEATCVFTALRAAQYIATIAFGIENSRTTCPNSKGLRNKLCGVNALLVINNFNLLATSLASAASVCAETINVEALCAASVTGLVSALALEGAAGIVIAEGCKPIQQFIRDNAKEGIGLGPKRRLDDFQPILEHGNAGATVGSNPDAPARRLFLGGNPSITKGQCVTDITTTAWSIAGIGLSIAGATTSCKTSIPESTTDLLQSLLLQKALCSADVNSILFNFGSVATFLQIAVLHCGGGLNLQAICGAGVSGMLAATAGLGRAVSGLYSACDIGIKLNSVQQIGKLAGLVGGGDGSAAEEVNVELAVAESRRLAEDPVGYLRERRDAAWHAHASAQGLNISYGEARRLHGLEDPLEGLDNKDDPKEIWARLGYDMDDPNPEWLVNAEEIANDNPEATDAFLRVMEPHLHEVGESLDEETKQKWPLWPSPFEDEL